MIGYYMEKTSWEHRQYFSLETGETIGIGFGHYGEFVASIGDREGMWSASDGIGLLPERFHAFLAWRKPIAPGHWQKTMVPQFDRVYGE